MDAIQRKSNAIQFMFSAIAGRYDLLNRVLSCGMDIRWRKSAVRELLADRLPAVGTKPLQLLDIATGTADIAIEIARQGGESVRVAGMDFSYNMLEIGKRKLVARKIDHIVNLRFADALALPVPNNSMDGAICAFGVRNFADVSAGLKELVRTLKPGGRAVILEFTTPGNGFLQALYRWYFTRVLPLLGGLVSGRFDAYKYLPDSVAKFPDNVRFAEMLSSSGLGNIRQKSLTLGIAAVHVGEKI